MFSMMTNRTIPIRPTRCREDHQFAVRAPSRLHHPWNATASHSGMFATQHNTLSKLCSASSQRTAAAPSIPLITGFAGTVWISPVDQILCDRRAAQSHSVR